MVNLYRINIKKRDMSLEDLKKREQEEFQKSELHAYRVLSLIKDVFKAGETDWIQRIKEG